MSLMCFLNTNLPLKCGHLSIQDTLPGPQGVHIRGVPLYTLGHYYNKNQNTQHRLQYVFTCISRNYDDILLSQPYMVSCVYGMLLTPPDVAMIPCDIVFGPVLHACGVGAGCWVNEEDS